MSDEDVSDEVDSESVSEAAVEELKDRAKRFNPFK